MPIRSYYRSNKWYQWKKYIKHRDRHTCQGCGESRYEVPKHVHHMTYERLMDEDEGDLILLCEDCHKLLHEGIDCTPLLKEWMFKGESLKMYTKRILYEYYREKE